LEKQFDREFKRHVPPRGLGDPPEREERYRFTVPPGFSVRRDIPSSHHGAVVLAKNMERMKEKHLAINQIDNGVEIHWKVANPERVPITGRTASMTVRLVGVKEETAETAVSLGFSNKYQKLRQRFFDDFYYEGLVAEWISGDHIKFADQTIYMGQTLIFLATEAFIKQRLGEDANATLQLVHKILDAIDRLDETAESLYGFPGELNGFLIRDDVLSPDDARLRQRFGTVESDGQNPNNAAPSGDQLFGLLYGLWFVVRLIDDSAVVERARSLSDRLYRFAQRCKFELKLPNGAEVERGADMRWLSSLFHGLNKAITGIDRFAESRIKVLGIERKLNDVAAFWDGAGSDIDDILRGEIDVPVIGRVSIKSFSAHIMLMAIAPSDIWSKSELEAAATAVNHHLSILTHALAHDVKPDAFHYDDVARILEKCPDSGPRGDLPTSTGWQKDNRWIRSRHIDQPGTPGKEYNGVDFLVLHNLAQIVYAA
jgi:hypothetical protein